MTYAAGRGDQTSLHFVAQVVSLMDLDIGTTTLDNFITINDSINRPFIVSDQTPPYVEIEGLYLPLIARNSS